MRWVVLSVVAGIATVSPGAAQVPLQLIPELRIGSVDRANYALTSVRALEVGTDGSIFVSQSDEATIRVFDSTGRFLRNIGRRGNGPGEFQDVSRLGWSGDTLWVSDYQQSRISMFSQSGELLNSMTIGGPILPGVSARPTSPAALLKDGNVLGLPSAGSLDPTSTPFVRMGRDGRLVETFGSRISDRVVTTVGESSGEQFRFLSSPVVQQGSLWSLTLGGEALVIVHRPLPRTSDRAFFEVELLRSAADTMFSRRYYYTPEPITRRMADSIVEHRVAASLENPPPWLPRQLVEQTQRNSVDISPFQAPVTAVVGGRDGTIWIRLEDIGVPVEWTVLDIRGEVYGYFRAPSGFGILQAERNMVWGTETDALGVQYVVRYAVEPSI